jgi:hypothetical protein
VEIEPSDEVCEQLRRHTHAWPMWTSAPGWTALAMRGAAWVNLRRASASGRG